MINNICNCKRTTWAEVFNQNMGIILIGVLFLGVLITSILTGGCK